MSIFITVMAVLLFLAGSQLMGYLNRSIGQAAVEQMEAEATEYKIRILKQINADFQALNTLAGFIGPEELDDMDGFAKKMEQANENNDFLSMVYLEREGSGVLVTLGQETRTDVTVEDISPEARPLVEQAWEGEAGVSRLFQSELARERVFVYAVPIYDGGKVIGSLSASDRLDIFADILEGNGVMGGNGYLHMVGTDGKMLIRSASDVVSEETDNIFDGPYFSDEEAEEAREAMSGQQPYYSEFTYRGKEYQFFLLPVGINGWYLMCMNTVQEAGAGAYRIARMAQITFLPVIGLMLFLMLYGYNLLKKNNRQLLRLAYQDQLTGAWNLTRFRQLLPESLEQAGGCVAVLNVRQFTFIQEIFGMEQSQRLLRFIKKTADKYLKEGEYVCRDTGDWFYLFLKETEPRRIHSRLITVMNEVAAITEASRSNYQLVLYCGVAIAQAKTRTREDAGKEANDLMTHVMFALDTARGVYQNNIWFYDAQLHKKEELENYVESHMHQALQDGEFHMYLQPKFDLKTGKLSGAEALVRWITGEGRMIYPDQFIPLFERNGFCAQLDLYMVECACRQLREWMDRGLQPVPISVNQSKLLFFQEDYVECLCTLTERFRVPPALITLEILEGIALNNADELNRKIARLQEKGFRISMDDFGSGFSSLNTLGHLKIDELKLDRGFLMNVSNSEDERTRVIMAQMIQMASSLRIDTVAEGVETSSDEEMLRKMGCHYGQGYYYSRPVDVAVFDQAYMTGKKDRSETQE